MSLYDPQLKLEIALDQHSTAIPELQTKTKLWRRGLSFVVVEAPAGLRMPALVAFDVDLGFDALDGSPRALALSTAQLSSNPNRRTAVPGCDAGAGLAGLASRE